jgi:hypothetical protein
MLPLPELIMAQQQVQAALVVLTPEVAGEAEVTKAVVVPVDLGYLFLNTGFNNMKFVPMEKLFLYNYAYYISF